MTGRPGGADLIIVGGGVVGLAVAREASAAGMEVVVVERGRAGREASWAAAGMLSPLGEALEPGPFLEFGLESLRRWHDFAAGLEADTGRELEFRRCGKLRLAFTGEEELRLRSRLRWAEERGVPARWLDEADVRDREPAVKPGAHGGLLLDEDYRVDSRMLGQALAEGCQASGVALLEGEAARGIAVRKGQAAGVRLPDGSTLEASRVLVAAGAWSGTLEGLPGPVPVEPARGQMAALEPQELPSDRILEWEKGYLVPRDDGRLLVGATEERVGYERTITAGGIGRILTSAVQLVPGLADAPVVELWSGLRPASPDGLPILGAHPEMEGLFLATGHFRNGILLAPATGHALVRLITGDGAARIPPEFAPGRFGGGRGGRDVGPRPVRP